METSMLQTITKTRDKVKFILDMFPESRNNDNLLCSIYWQKADGVQHLEGLQFATPAEAIRRARQLLNEKGLFLATDPEVLEKRRHRAKEIRKGITKI